MFLVGSSPDGVYGITYHYYSGSADNVKFTAKLSTTEGAIEGGKGQTKTFSATYSKANLNNTWEVQVEQFFLKEGYNYHSFSPIEVPSSGSRISVPLAIGNGN